MKGSAPADGHRWTVLLFRDRRGLEQQVDQFVSPAREEPTAEPTPCKNSKSFLPFNCSLRDSPCVVLFLVCPTGLSVTFFCHLSCPCCFLALIDRFDSLLWSTVLHFSPHLCGPFCNEQTGFLSAWDPFLLTGMRR